MTRSKNSRKGYRATKGKKPRTVCHCYECRTKRNNAKFRKRKKSFDY